MFSWNQIALLIGPWLLLATTYVCYQLLHPTVRREVGDYAAVEHRIQAPIALSTEWVGEQAAALFSGDTPPASLVSIVDRIQVPVLLIATNYALDPGFGHPPEELELSQIYPQRIGDNASVWYVDDASHTRALEVRPQEYAARVTAFLDAALSDTDH
jgi:hypothetical protein